LSPLVPPEGTSSKFLTGRAFIADREDIPINPYGAWNESILEDEGLAQEINLHLQGIGKYVKAMDIADFLDTPEMKRRLNRTKTIHISTAQRWMHKMGYRWTTTPKGQYVDGHEREDIVAYHQNIFLPKLGEIGANMRTWTKEGHEDKSSPPFPPWNIRRVVISYHDESTFYANDRRTKRWVHGNETAVPQPKGEGASLMVADFVSADYGWLRSPDGKEDARVLFKAGKAREGYFTNEDILKQTWRAMEILKKHYPDEDHVLIFDNATTHLKRPDEAVSARNMP